MKIRVCSILVAVSVAATVTTTVGSQQSEAADTIKDAGVHAALGNNTKPVHPVLKSTLNATRSRKVEMEAGKTNASAQAPSHVLSNGKRRTSSSLKRSHNPNTKSVLGQSGCQAHFQFRSLIIDNCAVIVRIKTCSGYCSSSASPVLRNYETSKQVKLIPVCNCCRPVKLSSKTTTRKCNGKSVQITLPEMSGCSCRPCLLM